MQELPGAHTPWLDPPQADHIGMTDAVVVDEDAVVVDFRSVLELCDEVVDNLDEVCIVLVVD